MVIAVKGENAATTGATGPKLFAAATPQTPSTEQIPASTPTDPITATIVRDHLSDSCNPSMHAHASITVSSTGSVTTVSGHTTHGWYIVRAQKPVTASLVTGSITVSLPAAKYIPAPRSYSTTSSTVSVGTAAKGSMKLTSPRSLPQM